MEITEQGERYQGAYKSFYQNLKVKLSQQDGKIITIEYGKNSQINKDQLLSVGQQIIVSKTTTGPSVQYAVYDSYRLNSILAFVLLFFFLVLLVAGKKGLGSMLGMLLSLATIIFFIVPSILKGADPLTITIAGSVFILLTTTFLAHGISKKTSIALFSTLASLALTVIFASFATTASHITGLGNEDLFSLQLGPTSIINIKGLFLSAVIIGTLGALNDITTSQSATVWELKQLDKSLGFQELFKRGLNVGKEHIASLVNTLVLAYAGSAFAIFIFLVLNPLKIPYWVILNNELVSDEIIKIVAGSVGLLLSVPIVTALASYIFAMNNRGDARERFPTARK